MVNRTLVSRITRRKFDPTPVRVKMCKFFRTLAAVPVVFVNDGAYANEEKVCVGVGGSGDVL